MVIRHNKRTGVVATIVGVVGVGIGFYCLRNPGFLNAWWFFACGGFGVLAGLWLLIDSRPKLIVDGESFQDLKSGLGELRWSQIAQVRTAVYNYSPYLYVRLCDPDLAYEKVTVQDCWKYQRPTDAAPDEVTVPLAGLDIGPDELLRLIEGQRAAAG